MAENRGKNSASNNASKNCGSAKNSAYTSTSQNAKNTYDASDMTDSSYDCGR